MFSHRFVLGVEYGFGAGFSIGDPVFVRKITNNAGPILSLHASVVSLWCNGSVTQPLHCFQRLYFLMMLWVIRNW